jgi:hypothetical protein
MRDIPEHHLFCPGQTKREKVDLPTRNGLKKRYGRTQVDVNALKRMNERHFLVVMSEKLSNSVRACEVVRDLIQAD